MHKPALFAMTLLLAGCTTVAGRLTGTPGEEWDTELRPQNGSSVRGSVEAKSGPGGTTATIRLVGGVPGTTHPWHLHRGKCGSNGAIVGEMTAYPPLVVGNDGQTSATASIAPDIGGGSDKDYHVNVHASPQNMAVVVSCGNLDAD